MNIDLNLDGDLAAAVEKSRKEGSAEVTLDNGKRYSVTLKRTTAVPKAFELDSGLIGRFVDWWHSKE